MMLWDLNFDIYDPPLEAPRNVADADDDSDKEDELQTQRAAVGAWRNSMADAMWDDISHVGWWKSSHSRDLDFYLFVNYFIIWDE